MYGKQNGWLMPPIFYENNLIVSILQLNIPLMTKSEELFHTIASGIPDTKEGKMFGALCIKAANGKAGVMFWNDDMIFKLSGAHEQEALALKGAKVFLPMDGRPMNGWIHIPSTHSIEWMKFADVAMDAVKKIEVEKKPTKPKVKAK